MILPPGAAGENAQFPAGKPEATGDAPGDAQALDGHGNAGKLAHRFSRPTGGLVEGDSGDICEYCVKPLDRGSRGPAARVHADCRPAYDRESRRIGREVLRRRRARQAQAPRPRFRLTASEGTRLVVLIAVGAMVTGLAIPGKREGREDRS